MTVISALAATPQEALERFFGEAAFRPGQQEAIEAVLAGEDTLVIMPTGSGKSLVYQVAALLLSGPVLVVSPLIALMRDQIEALRERGVPDIAALHSQVPEGEQRETLAALREGRLHLLYVTPERCAQEEFLGVARAAGISLLAVDEAHCISEWGHDFRPTYQLLDDAARALGRPPIVALTATATPWVRDDIIQRLQLRRPRVVARGFDRPNLFYEVYAVHDNDEKRRRLGSIVADDQPRYAGSLGAELARTGTGSGIVYTALTKSARSLSQWLNRRGVHAAYYHGQLRAGQRNAVQDRFREGAVRLIAATNAFGMGIDRADLRLVTHYDAPPSIEAYYQESGRAGRDGELARCPLLFQEEDLGRAAFAGGSGVIEQHELERVGAVLAHAPAAGAGRRALAEHTGLPVQRVVRALELLVAAGAVAERRGRYRLTQIDTARLDEAVQQDERRRAHDRTRLEMVRTYARAEGCRRRFLLQYFGQYDAPEQCGMCDRCLPRRDERPRTTVAAPATPAPDAPFQPGDEVEHQSWGRGTVQHIAERRVTVHFAEAGYRTLDVDAVVERELLRVADPEHGRS